MITSPEPFLSSRVKPALPYVITLDDVQALQYFLKRYPTWWWKIGVCDLTRDFDCGPQGHSPEAKYIKVGNVWDCGFQWDSEYSIAAAIEHVVIEICANLYLEEK